MANAVAVPEVPQSVRSRSAATVADRLWELGDLSASRVLLEPPPHAASEADLLLRLDSNAKREIERKLDDDFAAGARLAWLVNPSRRIVTAYSDRRTFTVQRDGEYLRSGEMLPGFRLLIRTWSAKAEGGRQ